MRDLLEDIAAFASISFFVAAILIWAAQFS